MVFSNKKLSKITILLAGLGTTSLLAFQNCGEFHSLAEQDKTSFLQSNTVFQSGSFTSQIEADILVEGKSPQGDPIELSFLCSDNRSQSSGNLAGASSILARVSDRDDQQRFCQFDITSMKTSIILNRSLDIETVLQDARQHCPSLADLTRSQAEIALYDPNHSSSNTRPLMALRRIGDNSPSAQIVFDYNRNTKIMPDINCDRSASPLVIHMNSDVRNPEPLRFTHPLNGVIFDILGLRSEPRAHEKKRISWHRSLNYYYIALPDRQGHVRGINELFGDNTLGPDREFALDGFDALAKYDGMSADGQRRVAAANGRIDRRDPIFSHLRLWQDRNFDGVAQSNELLTLDQMGITMIDLDYDPNYREVDEFGNEVVYKSIVRTRDGRMHLLFDVWFNYLDL